MYDDEILSDLERELLPVMESGFPVTSTPYETLANTVGSTEEEVLAGVRDLEDRGVVRRVGPIFEPRRLGYVSTLVGLAVPDENLDAAARSLHQAQRNTNDGIDSGDRWSGPQRRIELRSRAQLEWPSPRV